MSAMSYGKYLVDTAIGAVLWVVLILGAGWFLGGLPIVRDHFEIAVIGIIIVSMLPALFEAARHLLKKKSVAEV
jgi:membrane-associated protein